MLVVSILLYSIRNQRIYYIDFIVNCWLITPALENNYTKNLFCSCLMDHKIHPGHNWLDQEWDT
jgi:hypothetical protein